MPASKTAKEGREARKLERNRLRRRCLGCSEREKKILELELDWQDAVEANIRMTLFLRMIEEEGPTTGELKKMFPLDHYDRIRLKRGV